MKISGKAIESGMAILASLFMGLAFGMALDSIPIGLCLGIGFYPAFS